ncbi:MAG: Eco57I restriction-modification methylase domain-containing protein [Prevotellaceae bacterium]|jgi:hypothetical protein|nr:Eco57I restriction-modification methylase domain-containing protein [Prevotellaceae bacterium]
MKEIFSHKYPDKEDIINKILRPVLGNENYEPRNENILHSYPDKKTVAESANVKAIELIAIFNLDVPLYVFDITVADNARLAYSRVNIQRVVRSLMDNYSGALMFFHSENREGEWRMSFVKKDSSIANASTAKRYTYLLGEDHSCRTIIERFESLQTKEKTVKSLLDAFSVEVLTKEFYRELFDWYQWALSDNDGFEVVYPNDIDTATDDRNIEEHLIRLITRLMFVWFLKQKKSVTKSLIPENIFDEKRLSDVLQDFDPASKTSGIYYNAILQNLFFATLNRKIEDRGFTSRSSAGQSDGKEHYGIKTLYRDDNKKTWFKIEENEVKNLFRQVPFLNGGLFECLDKEKEEGKGIFYYDGFSRDEKTDKGMITRAFLPNCLFFDPEKGLLSILKKYNFTIEENTLNDIDVALDPELLGKVFENLLGAYNPETKETARKQSGSFYTPREIVNYMVDESLIAYCLNHDFLDSHDSQDYKVFVENLFDTKNQNSPVNQDLDNFAKIIYDKLLHVKILDPACGSGAFPMGVLNRIIDIFEKILPENRRKSIYELKLHLIENCIYGIDIQTIAIQISKLRFFISLICEQMPTDKVEDNYGIKPLPNLETKFVAANTLIGVKKKNGYSNLFEDPQIEVTKKSLLEVRHEHFSAYTAQKKIDCRLKDSKLREKLANLLKGNEMFAPEDAKQLAAWNPYDQNSSSPFFDPEWMFGLMQGFDIVIGNPPYVQLQNNGGELAKLYEKCGYKTFARTGDIYCLFYECGYQMLKHQGYLCFITSNKWMRAGYGQNTRKFFAENANPIQLIDFAGVKVFESATVDVNILMFSKDKNRQQTQAGIIKKEGIENLSVFIRQHGTVCSFSTDESWVILSPIEQRIKAKIEAVGTPLKDWNININYGIKTGFNEAFIISGEKRNELIAEDPKSAEIIRPILRGKDIKRYGYNFADKYVICARLVTDIPTNYPAICRHLEQYKGKSKLGDNSTTKVFKRPWWSWMQEPVSYWDDFSKQKIVYPNMTKYMPFFLDKNGFYTNQKCFIITGSNLAYLTAFFNSKVFKICYRDNFPELQGGTRELSKVFFEDIKIPPIEILISEDFDILVEDLQSGKDYADLRLERALLLALELQEYEDFIMNYKI